MTSTHYQIINDLKLLEAFVDWLPELEPHEKFYCSLFARKKYALEGVRSSDKANLKRFLASKEQLIQKIHQLEVPLGAYELKDGPAPQESLAFYINPNPRNMHKAMYDGIIRFTKILEQGHRHLNPHAEIMSCLQRNVSRKVFLDFDIDDKAFDLTQLNGLINSDAVDILETRGGFHILVILSKVEERYKKTFFNAIRTLGVDQVGDQLLPVPGCVQGGFTPRFINS